MGSAEALLQLPGLIWTVLLTGLATCFSQKGSRGWAFGVGWSRMALGRRSDTVIRLFTCYFRKTLRPRPGCNPTFRRRRGDAGGRDWIF